MSVSVQHAVEVLAKPMVDRVRTWCPGVVVSYNRDQRRAVIHAQGRLIVVGDDGEETEKTLPDADMPVVFDRGGGFFFAYDLSPGDAGRIEYSCWPLDRWKADGKEYAVRAGRYALGDAVFVPGATDYSHPGVVVPAGQMIIGVENGPRITFDKNTLTIEETAANEIRILGQARVRIESEGDVYIQGRWVDPTGGDI